MQRLPSFTQRLFRRRPEDSLPMRIAHQRIYILPTRRGWAFLFALLIMLIASVNYALSLGYALCFLLTGLFASALLHTYRNLAGLSVRNIKAIDTFAGQPMLFTLELYNSSQLGRVGIEVCSLDSKTVCDVATQQQTKARLSIPTKRRGHQVLGRVTLTSNYPLGLWRTWCYLHTPVQGVVFPQPEHNPPPLPTSNTDQQGPSLRRDNTGDISGLREYQPGDALTSIAWKAAARGQGLFVRQFENEFGHSETLLSLLLTGQPTLDAQLARLCAWVLQAENHQSNYSLELPDQTLGPGKGDLHKYNALIALALFQHNE